MELSTEENKTRLRAQRSAKNISDVIKDLFRSPPSYRTKVVVSWRSPGDKVAMSAQKTANVTAGVKRKAISFDGEKAGNSGNGTYFKKRQAGGNQIYEAPRGKYSANLGKVVEADGREGFDRSFKRGRGSYNRGRGGRGRGGFSRRF